MLNLMAVACALMCACALITSAPALAAPALIAEPSGSVGAGRISATPFTVTTPGTNSLAVSWTAAAGDCPPTTEGCVPLSAEARGSGVATYGALAGSAVAQAVTVPSPHAAAGIVHLNLAFRDTAEVVSRTLAPGTPVTLRFVMTLDGTASQDVNGRFTPGTIGAAARNEARILDIEAGTGTPTFPPYTVVQSLGERVTSRTFEFQTKIGHHLQFDVSLLISAGVSIEPFRFTGQATAGIVIVTADETARFFYEPLDDVRLVSESGHDYALSASPAGGVLCYKSTSTKGNLCSADAPLNVGRSCQIEEDCGGNSLDDAAAETGYCLPNKFSRGLRVSLLDALEPTTRIFDVKKPVNLCAPAGEAETHLQGYQILLTRGRCADDAPRNLLTRGRCADDAPRNPGGGCIKETDCSPVKTTTFCEPQPESVPQLGLSVSNPFHASPLIVDAVKPDRLLVPTATDPTDPPGPPEPGSRDHYKCYQAKVSRGTPKFEPILGVPVETPFTDGTPRVLDLKKPARLCLSAEKNGEARNDENAHLMCYQAVPAKKVCAATAPVNPGGTCAKEQDCGGEPGGTSHCAAQARFAAPLGLFVNNQFGPAQMDTTSEEELCVPSTLGGGI